MFLSKRCERNMSFHVWPRDLGNVKALKSLQAAANTNNAVTEAKKKSDLPFKIDSFPLAEPYE